MMSNDPNNKQKRGKLKITQERVVENVRFAIKTDGEEKGKLLFDIMNTYFSTEPGWPETAMEVRLLFAELREQEEKGKQAEKEAKRRLAEQKASMPPVLVMNQNTNTNQNTNDFTGIKHVDQLNGLIDENAEVSYNNHN